MATRITCDKCKAEMPAPSYTFGVFRKTDVSAVTGTWAQHPAVVTQPQYSPVTLNLLVTADLCEACKSDAFSRLREFLATLRKE